MYYSFFALCGTKYVPLSRNRTRLTNISGISGKIDRAKNALKAFSLVKYPDDRRKRVEKAHGLGVVVLPALTQKTKKVMVPPGVEPGSRDSESHVIPLHYGTTTLNPYQGLA